MKVITIFFCLMFLVSCANQQGTQRQLSCAGKITLDPVPLLEDIPPEAKIVKPKQALPPSNSGGVYFPKSAFSVLEMNIKNLRDWINGTRYKVEEHNANIDKLTQEIKKKNEDKKKGWFSW